MLRLFMKASLSGIACQAKRLMLFIALTGCATRPTPISSQPLESGGDWSVTEVTYTEADIKALPVYRLLPDENGEGTVEKAVAWCEDGRTPCCYQTQDGEVATCYQLVGRGKAVAALGKLLGRLLKRQKKGPIEDPPPKGPPKRPDPGVGGNGVASEFGSLHGMSRTDADAFLRSLGAEVRTTAGGYRHYKLPDKSELVIRPDGEVIRLPNPTYDPTGRRLNKGARLNETGAPTSNHNTGERVVD